MKTNHFSKLAKFFLVAAFAMLSFGLNAQHTGAAEIEQDSIEERKGSESIYSVPGDPADLYSWEVIGAESIVSPAAGVSGTGDPADPFVINFTAGLQSITVQWPEDDSTITEFTGNVSVQKQTVHTTVDCPSLIQSADILFWSNPTAEILEDDYEICDGDATSDITVEFAGAPLFDFSYTITDQEGNSSTVTETDIAGDSFTIDIPDNLANSTSDTDQTYVVELTSMSDAFGNGTLLDDTFTITIHPTVETGEISSNNSLSR